MWQWDSKLESDHFLNWRDRHMLCYHRKGSQSGYHRCRDLLSGYRPRQHKLAYDCPRLKRQDATLES